MGITVRRAVYDDIEWMLGQLKSFSRFFGTRRSLFGNEAHAREALRMMIDRHVVFIADSKDAKPIGFVGGYSIPHPFNPDIKLLSEMFWWVSEEHRGSRAGLMLLNAFTSYGKEHADWVTMAIEHNSPINERALTKRGYKLQERSYLLEVS